MRRKPGFTGTVRWNANELNVIVTETGRSIEVNAIAAFFFCKLELRGLINELKPIGDVFFLSRSFNDAVMQPP